MTSTAASATGTSTAAALAGIKRPRSGSGGTTRGGGAAGTGTGTSTSTSAAAHPQSAAAGDTRGSKNKKDGKDTTTAAAKGDDGESECTPEGLLMAHALGTLTSRQLTQFEAYRNVAFPADAVAAYVSHRLCHNEERRYVRRHGTAGVLGGGRGGCGGGAGGGEDGGVGETGLGVIAHSGWGEAALRRCPYVDHVQSASAASARTASTTSASASPTTVAAPPLRDMVAPETEQEVTAVVSALAKLHAQRLVAAARRLATAEGHPLHEPLRPHHVVQAKRYRTEAGLDPGFFMGAGGCGGDGQVGTTGAGAGGGCGGAAAAAALDVVDTHRLKMEAAIEAQQEYEARFEGGGEDDDDGGDGGDEGGEKEEENKEDGEKAATVKTRETGEKDGDGDGDAKMEE